MLFSIVLGNVWYEGHPNEKVVLLQLRATGASKLVLY
jgi:hypothetical protein